jgi:hypothetical protein
MVAFNVEETALQGRSAAIPPTWTKYPASRSAIQSNIIIYVVGAALLFGLALYLLINGSLPGGTRGDDSFAPFELVALFVFGCLFLSIGLRLFPSLFKSDQYFFFITGDGFVYAANKQLMGLPLAEISIAYRQVGLLGGKLVVRQHSGSALNIPLGHFYTTQAVREMEEMLNASLKSADKSQGSKRA